MAFLIGFLFFATAIVGLLLVAALAGLWPATVCLIFILMVAGSVYSDGQERKFRYRDN